MTDATTAQLLAGVKHDQAKNHARPYNMSDPMVEFVAAAYERQIRAGMPEAMAAEIARMFAEKLLSGELRLPPRLPTPPLEGTGPLPLERT